jgi:hypothetical protein
MRQPARARPSLVAFAALALGLAGASAYAQVCVPPSTPCQHCPPPTCTPTNTCPSGVALGPPGTTGTVSTASCAGSFSQNTVTTTMYIGPADLCVGPNRSVGCHVPSGGTNFDNLTETISASTAIPTLSIWGLGALAVGLGALALRRLTLRPPTS